MADTGATNDVAKQASPLHWTECGQGRPVVLIHGAFVTHSDWPHEIVLPLSKNARVIAIDRPGHGLSPRPPRSGDARIQAQLVRDALASSLDQPAVLVAHSFGALTALAFAEMFPEETAGLVLIAPVCFPEWRPEHGFLASRSLPGVGPVLSALANLTMDGAYLRLIQHIMFAPQPVPERWLSRYPMDQIFTPEAFLHEGEDAAAVSPLSPSAYRDLAHLDLPIHLLQGDSDLVILGGWHARLLAGLARRAKLSWLTGVGHMLHHACPERVVAGVRSMLSA